MRCRMAASGATPPEPKANLASSLRDPIVVVDPTFVFACWFALLATLVATLLSSQSIVYAAWLMPPSSMINTQ
jgi:hypothetical protein